MFVTELYKDFLYLKKKSKKVLYMWNEINITQKFDIRNYKNVDSYESRI